MSVRDKPLQCMHSPEKAQVCEGQAKVCTVLRRPMSVRDKPLQCMHSLEKA